MRKDIVKEGADRAMERTSGKTLSAKDKAFEGRSCCMDLVGNIAVRKDNAKWFCVEEVGAYRAAVCGGDNDYGQSCKARIRCSKQVPEVQQ